MIASHSTSEESDLRMTMTLWFIEYCLPKKKLGQWVATKLAIKRVLREEIQVNAEVVGPG